VRIPDPVLRIADVIKVTGLSRTRIYVYMDRNLFPRSIKLTDRAVAWRAADVQHWLDSRPLSK